MPPSTRDEFEVAIICALPREADAVEALFDKTYDKSNQLYGIQSGDANVYTNGKLGPHDVVLCCLSGIGKGNAASAASSLRVSYPSVQLALLVGICGAVRFTSDGTSVSLGDVILSDRVVEYDFGRRYPDGFEREKNIKETSGRHTRETRAILADLKTKETSKQFRDRVYQYLSTLQTHRDGVWQRPNNEDDTLSDTYTPSMHIGTMGSGDTVVKSADYRNKLATDEDMIGFEMEGAGIWDNIPCIIIKGVCDYADSQKNKIWQDYAAATGASAAKAFLEHWRPTIRNGQ